MEMSKEITLKYANAFRAMRAIRLKEVKVKPVLKTLLKLYNNNWALIEKENYRVLADAMFERDQSKTREESEEAEEPKRPMKKLKRGHLDGQTSSLNTSNTKMPRAPLVRPKEEPKHGTKLKGPQGMEELSEKSAEKTVMLPLAGTLQSLGRSKGKQPNSSNSLAHEKDDSGHPNSINRSQQSPPLTNEPRLVSYRSKLRDRGRETAALQTLSKDKRSVSKSSSDIVQLKESKVERDTMVSPKKKKTPIRALIKPKDERITDDIPSSGVPVVMAHIDTSNGKSVINDATKLSAQRARREKASGISSSNGLPDSHSGAKVPQPNVKVLSPSFNDINGGPQLNKLVAGDETVINRENHEKCAGKIVDIAKGLEFTVITAVNEVNDELPPSFCYIRQNAVFQNAFAHFSLARIADDNCCAKCSGDCLSVSLTCACSYETGGEFAYARDGLVKEEFLKECISMNRNPENHCQFFCKDCPLERSTRGGTIEPCKGHLVRRFIKECWIKCGCNIQCGNRVVQRGISRKLQVFMTPGGKGWGLRTLEDLPQGAFVCEYVGEVLTNTELFERVLRSPAGEKHSYPVLLDADWCVEGVLKDEEALCLDATYYGNVARFINHKCHDSNLVEIPVEVETPDHHYYHLAFFTTREVKAMEELTWDYGIDFDDREHPIKAFRCRCGSKFCRDKRRSRSRAGRR